jgi:DNA-binding PadR family transcriptional regulator
MMPSNKLFLERDLLRADVFRSLARKSIHVYFDFRMKCRWQKVKKSKRRDTWVIANNGDIEYTYTEAEKRGISRASFMRAIDELVEKGFLDISHSGSGGIKGDKSKYAISDRWRDWGTEFFVKQARPKDKRNGRGFAVYWKNKRGNHKYQKRKSIQYHK